MNPIVLVHGWGMKRTVFDELRTHLSARHEVRAIALAGYEHSAPAHCSTVEALAADVAKRAPARCCVAGWSLGGQVAMVWASLAPRQVAELVLLSTTPSFVQRAGWQAGVESAVLEQFAAGLDEDREATLRRFIALQAQRDMRARETMRNLNAHAVGQEVGAKTLRQGLQILLQTDLRTMLASIVQPALVIHGERDALVPLAAGEHLACALPAARFSPIRGCAHAPFVSDAPAVSRSIVDFLNGG